MVFVLAMFAAPLAAQATPSSISEEQAREEVNTVYARILGGHPDPFWYTNEEQWREVYNELLNREGPISVEDHYFDLSRLMALTFDTHVQIYPEADTSGFESSYPLRFRLYEEGIFVTAADDPYRSWVGRKIVAIAGQPIDDVISRLEAVSFSDHSLRKRTWAIEYLLPHPATYRYFGLMDANGMVQVTFERADGSSYDDRLSSAPGPSYDTLSRSGINAGYYWPEGWRTLNDLAAAKPPLTRSRLSSNYWFTEIANGKMIYVQLNRPFDAEDGESLFDFWLRLFQQISAKSQRYKRLILDVRYDLGGSISLSQPAPYIAQASYLCCKPGGLVILTGRETISAGSIMVGGFERASRPVTVGEPTGSRANMFLNHTQIPLEHSGLFAEASTSTHTSTVKSDRRLMIAPDVLVPERIVDVLAGRDAALEAAIALTEEQAESFYTRGRNYRAWTRPSQDVALPDN
jgi:hypothetical protein